MSSKKIFGKKLFIAVLLLFGFVIGNFDKAHAVMAPCPMIVGDTELDGYTDDTYCPWILNRSPIDGSTGVSPSATVSITWAETTTTTGAGNFYITNDTTTVVNTIACSSLTAGGPGNFSTPLGGVSGTPYHVTWDSNCFSPGLGSAMSDSTFWNFTTSGAPDVTPPSISSLSPTDGSTGVAVDTNLAITFDENVNVAIGNVYIRRVSDNVAEQTISIASAAVTGSGSSTLTINPPVDLSATTAYYIQIDASAVDDIAGNSFAGILDTTTWNITTGTIAPNITSLHIGNRKAFVCRRPKFTMIFDQNVNLNPAGSISISDGGPVVEGPISCSALNTAFTGDGTSTITYKTAATLPVSGVLIFNATNNCFQNSGGTNYSGNATPAGFKTMLGGFCLPYAVGFSPADNSTGVAITSNLVITFEQNVQAGAGNIVIYNSGGSVFETIPIGDARVTISGTTVTINPTANLVAGASYYVNVDSGAIRNLDLPPEDWEGVSGSTTWNFTAAAAAAPTLVTSHPLDDATGVETNTSVFLRFSEDMETVPGPTGSVSIVCDGPGLCASLSVIGCHGVLEIHEDRVKLNLAGLLANKNYHVDMSNDCIRAVSSGVYFAGISDPTVVNFSTGASTGCTWGDPCLTPADEATGVAIDADMIIEFKTNWDGASTADVELYRSPATLVSSATLPSATVTGAGTTTLTYDSVSDMTTSAGHYAHLETIVEDAGGAAFITIDDSTTWNFTTTAGDVTPPSISSLSPTDGSTGVAVGTNFAITFTEAVNVATGNVRFHRLSDNFIEQTVSIASGAVTGDGTATLTINPPSDLSYSTAYYVQIDASAVDDLAGNSFAGIMNTTTWNVTTGAAPDMTPPSISSLSPTDGSTGVAIGTNFAITFTEPVSVAVGNVYIRRVSDNVAEQTISIASGAVTGSGTATLTINPPVNLSNSTAYYLQIDATAVDDLAGNSFAGILDTTTWNIDTVAAPDVTSPSISGLSPADDSTGVPVGSDFVITFDEAVNVAAGNVYIRRTSDNVAVHTLNIAGPNVTGDGTASLTFDLPTNLNTSTQYYVQIDASAVDDLAGNSFAGIASTTQWDVTTAAGSGVTTDPYDGETNVCTTRGLTITFPQNMYSDRNSKHGTINVSCDGVTLISELCEPGTFSGSGTNVLTKDIVYRDSAHCSINISNNCIHDNSDVYWGGTKIEFDTSSTPCSGGACVPIRTIINPLDNAINVPLNADLELSFASEVLEETAYDQVSRFTIHRASDNSVYAQYDLHAGVDNSASLLTVDGIGTTNLTIDPKTNLPPSTGFYINYNVRLRECGTDVISDTTTWNFTTGATAPLLLQEKTPRNNRLNVGIDSYLELEYDNPAYRGSGSLRIYRADDDTLIDTIPAASSRIYGIGTPVVRIFPVNGLVYRTDYYILADEGFLNGGVPTLPSEEIKRVSNDDKKKWYFRTIQMHSIPFFRNWTDDR